VIAPADETHVYDELYEPIVTRGLGSAARQYILSRYDGRPIGEDLGLHLLVTRDALVELLERAEASGRPMPDAAEDVIAAVLEGFIVGAEATSGRVFVEKTPSHILHAQRILRRFPEARIVEVLRDGRDVCVSMQHRAAEAAWVPKSRDEQIRRWVEAVQFGMGVRATPEAAGRWHVFRFEEAKHDPWRAIAELFTFCGLPFDPVLVDRVTASTDFSRVAYAGDGQMFRRGAVGDWRTDFNEADVALFARLASETLVAAGYDL
jgi:hypothetical protein